MLDTLKSSGATLTAHALVMFCFGTQENSGQLMTRQM